VVPLYGLVSANQEPNNKGPPVNNSFCKQFSPNIKFKYNCFDRVILRGYIRKLFYAGGVVILLRVLGFRRLSNGIMRLLTDQLNGYIQKVTRTKEVPIHWWRSMEGGKDGAKSKSVQEQYARPYTGKGDHLYCILTDKEPVRTFVCREGDRR
jgi:hypothetical protein